MTYGAVAPPSCGGGFLHRLIRRKTIDVTHVTDTQLARCLSTLDLAALGIGSTLGAGIYVVAGQVARETAGPSVILSFLVAAIASFFAGVCYAEFGARVPKTGSAYVYCYIMVGEFTAHIIGWNLILEYMIGTASVARAWTSYIDSLANNTMAAFWQHHLPMHVPGLSPYPDFSALLITLLLTAVLALGVKESSVLNNIFTSINLLVVIFVVIAGLWHVDVHNWQIPEAQLPANSTEYGSGGFFPWGISGTLSGAATCFYAFVGFDCIATTGEEVRNPQRAIPISIILCLIACCLAYVGVSAILTLMSPYYLLDKAAPLPEVFEAVGWPVAKYVISVGAITGLSTSLLGVMFPMPRIIYAMASDGLLFRFLARVNQRFKTPLVATAVSGTIAGVMAMLFELSALVDMMSIGTLLAYTLVAASVLILRYDLDPMAPAHPPSTPAPDDELQPASTDSLPRRLFSLLFNPRLKEPTATSAFVSKMAVGVVGACVVLLCALLVRRGAELAAWWVALPLALLCLVAAIAVAVIVRQPQASYSATFKVPLVPLIPLLSMFINIYLMMKLNLLTWVRFAIWMALGLLIYFAYGMWHSSEDPRNQQTYEELHSTPSSPDNTAAGGAGGGDAAAVTETPLGTPEPLQPGSIKPAKLSEKDALVQK